MPDPAPINQNPPAPEHPDVLAAPLAGDAVPEKFRGKPVAELLKSYGELEKKLGASKPATPATLATDPLAPVEVSTELPDDAPMDAYLAHVGVKPEELTESWQKDGKLSDEQYAKFKAKGIPRSAVNAHMQSMFELSNQTVQREVSRAESIAGGKVQHENLREWAKSLPAAELKELGDQVKAKTLSYSNYIQILNLKHAAALSAGNAKPLIEGGASAPSNGLPKDGKEMSSLIEAATRGDESAINRLKSIPNDKFAELVNSRINS